MSKKGQGLERFTINVPEAVLNDLRGRLTTTRWTDDFANDDWRYGANTTYICELADYWRDRYDWRDRERAMNGYAHFRTEMHGIPLHFVHERGKGPTPIPLLLIHGWPWSFWDYHKVIGPLTDPAAYGGSPDDAPGHELMPSANDKQLIEELTGIFIPMGMTPIEARVQALLMISPEPVSLDEIVDILEVSKSSASVAARELERHGAAQRFSERGSKRIRYGLADHSVGFLSAQVGFLGSVGNVLRNRADGAPGHPASARLRDMSDFYLRVRDALEAVLRS